MWMACSASPALSCFTGGGSTATLMVGGRTVERDGGTALCVAVDLPWTPRTALRVPSRRVGGHRALWTTPIATLKSVLLASLRDNTDDEHEAVCITLLPGIRRHHTEDTNGKAKNKAATSNDRVYVALLACGRCGRPSGCNCGWRARHPVPLTHETQTLAQLLPRILPNASSSELMAQSAIHLQLYESRHPPAAWLEASVTQYKIIDPIVERPRAVFLVEVRYGDQQWSVSRRFTEFAQLHATLLQESKATSSATLLPPLPPATWIRRLDHDFVDARRLALTRYLRSLLLIDAVCGGVALLSFLGVVSTNQKKLIEPSGDSLCPLDVMHLRVLQYYVHAGDLVLFQSRGTISSLQRSVTGSVWDHVGIIVPRSSDDAEKGFYLLEATGDGVTATSLSSRLYAYSAFHTTRMVLRQLQTPLLSPAVRNELLCRFTERVKGLPYGLSMSKVLRTNNGQGQRHRHGTSAAQSPSGHAQRNYFCSELVADAYKALGLINVTIPSSNFWPSSFSSGAFVDSELSRRGASLDAAIAIDCHVLEVALAKRVGRIT